MNDLGDAWRVKPRLRDWCNGFQVVTVHRVAGPEAASPFHRLRTTPVEAFRRTLRLLARFWEIVPLDACLDGQRPGRRPGLVITFDDVPRSFLTDALPVLREEGFPATIYPCVRILEEGFGWRDLVYQAEASSAFRAAVQVRVRALLGEEEARALATMGLYRWSKRAAISGTVMEHEILRPVLGEAVEQMRARAQEEMPYLRWEDLRTLAADPLVTIGNHGTSHYDYRRLSAREIGEDIRSAHEALTGFLDKPVEHFACPFGALDQRVWLAADPVLKRLGYRTTAWVDDVGRKNVRRPTVAGVTSVIRVMSAPTAVKTLGVLARGLWRPVRSPKELIPIRRFAGGARVDERVAEEEYRQFYALLAPQKRHHQAEEYYRYQFRDNPFRPPEKPVHIGIRFDSTLEAIASLIWMPFRFFGADVVGAYFSGWWRFPEVHAADGAKGILHRAEEIVPLLAGYCGSTFACTALRRASWREFSVERLRAGVSRAHAGTVLHANAELPAAVDPLFDAMNRAVDVSVARSRAYYQWRFGSYPFMKFEYLMDTSSTPEWLAVVGERGSSLWCADVVVADPSRAACWNDPLRALTGVAARRGLRDVITEGSANGFLASARRLGFRTERRFVNFYAAGGEVRTTVAGKDPTSWRVHETMATSDILPR